MYFMYSYVCIWNGVHSKIDSFIRTKIEAIPLKQGLIFA